MKIAFLNQRLKYFNTTNTKKNWKEFLIARGTALLLSQLMILNKVLNQIILSGAKALGHISDTVIERELEHYLSFIYTADPEGNCIKLRHENE